MCFYWEKVLTKRFTAKNLKLANIGVIFLISKEVIAVEEKLL